MQRFKPGDIVKEDGMLSNLGVILQAGKVTYDIVWQGGSTSRYRYSDNRSVKLATKDDLDGQAFAIKHLREEAAQARQERRTGARVKRGQIWPSR